MDSRLTVSIDTENNVVSMQKGGNTPFDMDEINSCIERAISHSNELRKLLP